MNYEEYIQTCKDIKKYQDAYYINSNPLISDEDFDFLFNKIIEFEKQNPSLILQDSPTKKIGTDIDANFEIKKHYYKILSLDKVSNIEDFEFFINKMVLAGSKSFIFEEKIDGLTLILVYKDGLLVDAISRGDGEYGNSLIENALTIKNIPIKLTDKNLNLCIRGEVYISKSDFETFAKDSSYINPRNFASGILRRVKSLEVSKYPLRFIAYEVYYNQEEIYQNEWASLEFLASQGFDININNISNVEFVSMENFIAQFKLYLDSKIKLRDSINYDIDGLVIKVDEYNLRQELGNTEHHPRWAVAYKFSSPSVQTSILDIVIQVGRTGKITPVAITESVFLGNANVNKASLHNQDYIKSINCNISDTVLISKKGDIIPAIDKVIEKNSEGYFILPDNCPSCKSILVDIGAHKYCKNYNCYAKIKQKINYFCSKSMMDIQTLGIETLELFIKLNIINDIGDIYRIPFFQIQNFIDGNCDFINLTKTKLVGGKIHKYDLIIYPSKKDFFGIANKKLMSIKNSIQDSRNKPLYKTLSAFGISDMGIKTCKILIDNGFDFHKIINLKRHKKQFVSIDGFGQKMYENILKDLQDKSVLKQMKDVMSYMSPAKDIETVSKSLFFNNQKWCITGNFENFKPRQRAIDLIKSNGGIIVDSVSKNLDFLLCGKDAGTKLEKAQKLNIKLIYEQDFLDIIEKNNLR